MSEKISNHEKVFNEFIKKEYLTNKKTSTSISKEEGQLIIDAIIKINKNETIDPAFKRRIKKRNFTIKEENNDHVLYCNDKKVVYAENFYDVLNTVHSVEMGHPGVIKTVHHLKDYYSCIPRPAVEYAQYATFECLK